MALQRSESAPADPAAAVAAAVALFAAADLRLQRASLAWIDEQRAATLPQILTADDQVADPARTDILSLCTAGVAAAERALANLSGATAGAEPTPVVAAHLQLGLHLSLVAWANGPARSLFAGYGPRLVAAIDAAVAADPTFDHGAPLRLQGRFRGRAPWPYGDRAAARAALQQAVGLAPIVVNQLFLGDVLYADGEPEAARTAWQAAIGADGSAATQASDELLRELARRRLQALGRSSGG